MVIKVFEFQVMVLEVIFKIVSFVCGQFCIYKIKNVEWCKMQFCKFYWVFEDFKFQFVEVFKSDFGKFSFEVFFIEVDWVKKDCMWMFDYFDSFVKDQKLGFFDVFVIYFIMNFCVKKEFFGIVFIIGFYNYFIQFFLCFFVGVIVVGCIVVFKFFEFIFVCVMWIKELIEKCFDFGFFLVVNGVIFEINVFMIEKWDKIFFIGSVQVGFIIV